MVAVVWVPAEDKGEVIATIADHEMRIGESAGSSRDLSMEKVRLSWLWQLTVRRTELGVEENKYHGCGTVVECTGGVNGAAKSCRIMIALAARSEDPTWRRTRD